MFDTGHASRSVVRGDASRLPGLTLSASVSTATDFTGKRLSMRDGVFQFRLREGGAVHSLPVQVLDSPDPVSVVFNAIQFAGLDGVSVAWDGGRAFFVADGETTWLA